MIRISKRFLARAKPALRQYQRVLEGARARDVNESDTVTVVSDLLSNVLGYDKYAEITTEHAIRGTYCDLAVQMKGAIRFLIEVKAIGKDLPGQSPPPGDRLRRERRRRMDPADQRR